MPQNGLEKQHPAPQKLKKYELYLADEIEQIELASSKFNNPKVMHLNATAIGGGVAEMLVSQVPLERDIGLNSSWFVIPGDSAFFEVTKKIHNLLQGKKGTLTTKEKNVYIQKNKLFAKLLDEQKVDILIIHDPQPLASVFFMHNRPKLTIWRCHIDTSFPNNSVTEFLHKYLNVYDHYIYTMKDFVHESIDMQKVTLMTPVIDPFAKKNTLISKTAAKKMLEKLGIDTNKPLVTQVSRLDPWKDPIGVIDAFELAKKDLSNLQLAFVAQMASDDPEGIRVAEQVKNYAKSKKDIYFFINLKENEKYVNAFQTASDIIMQKSLKEGFALTVTEAMWKKAIVIGGNVGGIKLQIEDGINGFLVNSIREASDKIKYILNNPREMEKLSKRAHESVKSRYLMPHLLLNEMKLFERYI